ncbi:MAG: type I 3-dehydroquinate dehydratase [Verrucomicrobia bacterium]|nr:type I 3-dehydroquinate dehydratase [Verrucomicrobiota bacterium]
MKLSNLPRPFVVGVVVERGEAASRRAAAAAFRDGAAAVELNLASLPDDAQPGRVFFARLPGPVYTSCRRAPFLRVYGPRFGRVPWRGDAERMALQLAALTAGSAGLDLEADTFAAAPDEWTQDRSALRRQAEVVRACRRAGRTVIYSWHPPRKLRWAEARRAVDALRDRGADIVKVVERVRGIAEALDSVHLSLRLAERCDFPFIFLPLGPGAERVRPFMTAFGASYLLARPPVGSNRLPAQPPVRRAVELLRLA